MDLLVLVSVALQLAGPRLPRSIEIVAFVRVNSVALPVRPASPLPMVFAMVLAPPSLPRVKTICACAALAVEENEIFATSDHRVKPEARACCSVALQFDVGVK